MWYCNINSKQYGPVDIEVLRSWTKDSRLAPSDLVWREGMENWVAANTIEELRGYFAPPVHSVSQQNKTVPSQAITCMVLGILSIVINCGGLIFGLLALNYRKKALDIIKSDPGKYTGEGFCTAGYVTGIIGVIVGSLAILYIIFWIIMMLCFVGAGVAANGMH